ncbi:MAG: hypothetical protein Q8L48_34665 [Archangium sp.]|nr:hypothetical protein [Archangium sp.]
MNRTLACLVAVLSFTALAQSPRRPHRQAPPRVPGPTRVELSGSEVKGQRHTAEGVTLVERKQLPMRSMITTPTNFRSEILDPG